jgi:putative MFS transporter
MMIICTSLLNTFSYMGWSAAYTITPESYPTYIRNSGVGWANACGKFGGLIAPIIAGGLLELQGGMMITLLLTMSLYLIVGVLASALMETRGLEI